MPKILVTEPISVFGLSFPTLSSDLYISGREFQPKNRCCLPTLKVSYFNRTENSEHHTF